jgi:acyl-coenzyme A synthetase/AMP-(fatty) acid ligase
MPDEAGELPRRLWCAGGSPADELMAYVTGRVAPHKKIRAVEFMDQLPKSATGRCAARADRASASRLLE